MANMSDKFDKLGNLTNPTNPTNLTFITDIDPPSYYVPEAIINNRLCVHYWYNVKDNKSWRSVWWVDNGAWCVSQNILQDIREIMNYG